MKTTSSAGGTEGPDAQLPLPSRSVGAGPRLGLALHSSADSQGSVPAPTPRRRAQLGAPLRFSISLHPSGQGPRRTHYQFNSEVKIVRPTQHHGSLLDNSTVSTMVITVSGDLFWQDSQ